MRWTAVRRSIPGAWRWRRNPLRRASDVVEAWIGLAAVVVTAVAAPAVGVTVGEAVDSALRRVVAEQHAERHHVEAVVERMGRSRNRLVDPDNADDQATGHAVVVSWRSPDGVRHTAVVDVVGRHPPGTTMRLWINRHGRPVEAPLDPATAVSNAIAAGFGAAVAVAALVMAARHLLGWRILRRRMADWERDWLRVGEDWGRTGGQDWGRAGAEG
jgi:hypothetical protein